jgi:hypothetical protein
MRMLIQLIGPDHPYSEAEIFYCRYNQFKSLNGMYIFFDIKALPYLTPFERDAIQCGMLTRDQLADRLDTPILLPDADGEFYTYSTTRPGSDVFIQTLGDLTLLAHGMTDHARILVMDDTLTELLRFINVSIIRQFFGKDPTNGEEFRELTLSANAKVRTDPDLRLTNKQAICEKLVALKNKDRSRQARINTVEY